MILAPRSRFGPYDVIDRIGAGGMGEVYRARDPKLGRDVAIKVMRASLSALPERHAAFEREARLLASLNHPHIATVYGFVEGPAEAGPPVQALVLELVDGETLAARLKKGRLPEADALRYAVQIADALAYAHQRGVVHRDVKPTNIVVTPQGAKLLDFGLAHLVPPFTAAAAADGAESEAVGPAGTPFYMSPEQNAGLNLDYRTDIYSFGLVLCQMLTGFIPDSVSGISTRTLIRALLDQIPSRPLRLVIERCLASDPDERWLHAHDLRHALVAVSAPLIGDARSESDEVTTTPVFLSQSASSRSRWTRRTVVAMAIGGVGAAAAAFLVGKRVATVSPPAYQQLTFRRGTVLSARFAGDNTIVYGAAWDGRPPELWSMRPENPESRPLGIANATVLGVSPSGEMAILIGRRTGAGGMLARLSLDSNAPRDVLAGVNDADWSRDGSQLAVSHVVDGKSRLEFPIGTVLYETEGWIDGIRVSPDNEYIAFINHPLISDDRGTVSVIPSAGGTPQVISGPWSTVTGAAWSPEGDEVWFTAAEFGVAASLYAADLSGNVRIISRAANRLTIRDVAPNGQVLITEGRYRLRITAVDAANPHERDLSWLDGSVLTDLSPDGTTLLINEVGAGAGTPLYAVYARKTDGSAAIRLGNGASPALSPDGRWAAALFLQTPPSVVLLPMGAGKDRMLERGPLAGYQTVTWFPDGRRVLIAGNAEGAAIRLWTQDVNGGPPTPIGPEGLRIPQFSRPISPDGRRAIAVDLRGQFWLHSLDGSEPPHPLDGLESGIHPIRWHADGTSFYFFRQGELPGLIERYHLRDSRRERVAVLAPEDSAGVRALTTVQTTPEGQSFAYSYGQILSDLFLLRDVR
jgi:serine/threonine protein kinase